MTKILAVSWSPEAPVSSSKFVKISSNDTASRIFWKML